MPRGSKSGSWSAKRSASKRFASGKVGQFSTKGARTFGRSERRGHALVSSVKGVGAIEDESARELLADIADHLHPGIEHVDELSGRDRSLWILIHLSIGEATPEEKESMRLSLEERDMEVETQVSDIIGRPNRPQSIKEKVRQADPEHRLPADTLRQIEEETADLEERVRLKQAQQREEFSAVAGRLLPPPPPSPTYDRLFGNQIRWAIHVIRYALQQRRLKLADPETK